MSDSGQQSLVAEHRQQAVDYVVYRPAEGAGQEKSRRLRLGGKQKPAGFD